MTPPDEPIARSRKTSPGRPFDKPADRTPGVEVRRSMSGSQNCFRRSVPG